MTHQRDHKAIYARRKARAELARTQPTFGTTVLAIPDDLTLDQWAAIGNDLRSAINSTPWWVGDWLVYAQQRFETDEAGNAVSSGVAEVNRRLADLGFEHAQTLRCLRVAAKFPPAARREELSWAHHDEVSALDSSTANHLLNEAVECGWSTAQLRDQVRRHKALNPAQEALPGHSRPVRFSVRFTPPEDPQVLVRLEERLNAVLAELGIDGQVKLAS
jgi:hypothetical protein